MGAAWKPNPLFVGSKFLEMQAERDQLTEVIFPRPLRVLKGAWMMLLLELSMIVVVAKPAGKIIISNYRARGS